MSTGSRSRSLILRLTTSSGSRSVMTDSSAMRGCKPTASAAQARQRRTLRLAPRRITSSTYHSLQGHQKHRLLRATRPISNLQLASFGDSVTRVRVALSLFSGQATSYAVCCACVEIIAQLPLEQRKSHEDDAVCAADACIPRSDHCAAISHSSRPAPTGFSICRNAYSKWYAQNAVCRCRQWPSACCLGLHE